MSLASPGRVVRREGFTLIELLIVISIIAVLMSIILPAIIKVRDSADKLSCANNLRQIGHAAWSHIHEHGYLPTAGKTDYCGPLYWGPSGTQAGATTAPVSGWKQDAGWAFQLLPYLDEEYIWTGYSGASAANMTAALSNGATTSSGGGGFKVYACPARRNLTSYLYQNSNFPSNYSTLTNTQFTVVPCDYAGCNGGLPVAATLPTGVTGNVPANDGVILSQYNGRAVLTLKDVTGNHSRILMFGEKAANPRLGTWLASAAIINEDDMGYAAAFGSTYSSSTTGGAYTGPVNFNTIRFTAQTLLPLHDYEVKGTAATGGAFGSPHPGSWNACMLDGSVQQLSYNMDSGVYAGIGKRTSINPATNGPVSDSDLLP